MFIAVITINNKSRNAETQTPIQSAESESMNNDNLNKDGSSIANPASTYCQENGGTVEIVTTEDGSQFGLCKFESYSCEEWAYYYGNCDIEKDSEAIRQALVGKGLDLSNSTVKIMKHLGRDIEAGVIPNEPVGGGGYVFAIKTDDGMKILADGNGIISCDSFKGYEDYSDYLVPQCVNANGDFIER